MPAATYSTSSLSVSIYFKIVYYYEYGTLEAALKYSNCALEAQKQLHKELVERDM